jgi:hypothetical protein
MYDEQEPRVLEKSVEVPVTVTVEWSNDDVVAQTVSNLTARILMIYKDEIEKRVFSELDKIVNAALMEVVNKEVTLTDKWGDPQAKPTSVRAILQQSAEAWLTTKVDNYGRSGGRIYGRSQTRAAYLFEKTVGDSLKGRVKKIIQQEVGSLDDLIADEVRAQLRKKIK